MAASQWESCSFFETVPLDGQRSYPHTWNYPIAERKERHSFGRFTGDAPMYWKTPGVVPEYIIADDDQYEYVDGTW